MGYNVCPFLHLVNLLVSSVYNLIRTTLSLKNKETVYDWILKTNWFVTLGLFHFIGPANGYTCTLHIHSVITRLGWLVCFSRVTFTDPVNSWLRYWDPRRALHGRHNLYNVPSMILQWFSKKLLKIQQCKLASRNSYKTLAKRLFQLYSISGVATI